MTLAARKPEPLTPEEVDAMEQVIASLPYFDVTSAQVSLKSVRPVMTLREKVPDARIAQRFVAMVDRWPGDILRLCATVKEARSTLDAARERIAQVELERDEAVTELSAWRAADDYEVFEAVGDEGAAHLQAARTLWGKAVSRVRTKQKRNV